LQADGEGRPLDELCQAVVVTAKDRPQTPSWNHATPPAIPDWRLVDVAALAPPLAPVFTQHFEFRVTGAIPYTAQPVASASGFVRPVSGGVVDVAALAACADAWWPAALATFDAPRPMATITYALELHDVDIDAHEPLYFRSRADVARDGYCTEHRELWTPDGRLVASNQQLFAIIR
jgi:hypothetical protein